MLPIFHFIAIGVKSELKSAESKTKFDVFFLFFSILFVCFWKDGILIYEICVPNQILVYRNADVDDIDNIEDIDDIDNVGDVEDIDDIDEIMLMRLRM